jgi:hypothetical protein
MHVCTRCKKETERVAVIPPRPMGMTWFTPSRSEFKLPEFEHVCESCITPLDASRDFYVKNLVEFVLSGMQGPINSDDTNRALEHVKALFTTRNNSTTEEFEDHARRVAFKLMVHVKESETEEILPQSEELRATNE